MKRGFTLVELSIVLVIIGLLIGGVLVAQSMISTAKIQGVVRQLQQYDIAVVNFQTRYKQLPGDSTIFPSGGDNDGLIACSDEGGSFWYHLSLGIGLKNSSGSDFQPFTCSGTYTKLNCPSLDIRQYNGDLPCLAGYFRGTPDIKNYYNYDANAGNIITNGPSTASLYPIDALAIDKKIDDALPGSGRVLSEVYGVNTIGTCINGSSYNTANQNFACIMFFEMGSISGFTTQ